MTKTPLEKMLDSKLEKIRDRKRKDVKFKSNQQCRYFDVVVDEKKRDLHYELILEFARRRVNNPRGGSSGPYYKNGKMIEGYYQMIFWLDESVADEYIERIKKG